MRDYIYTTKSIRIGTRRLKKGQRGGGKESNHLYDLLHSGLKEISIVCNPIEKRMVREYLRLVLCKKDVSHVRTVRRPESEGKNECSDVR